MSITRRDFLKAGSTGLLSIAAFSHLAKTAPAKVHPANRDLWRANPRILVIGVGSAGGAVVSGMMNRRLPGVEHIWVHTDARAMERHDAEVKLLIGQWVTHGLGTGSSVDYGRRAIEESRDKVQQILAGADLVLLTGGMGGGTVTAAAPVIAQLAREAGALTVAVVTRPFQFEGRRRNRQAQDGILEQSQSADTTIVVPGDKMIQGYDGKGTFRDIFRRLDATIVEVLRSIIRTITDPGLICVDYSDIRAVMENRGLSATGIGMGSGPDRCVKAVEEAFGCPLFAETHTSFPTAGGMLVDVAGHDISLREIEEMMDAIRRRLAKETIVVVGDTPDPSLRNQARVTLIAAGIGDSMPRKAEGRSPFKRFTEEARTVVIRAKDNAKSRNHTEIDVIHFLLALTQEEDNAAAFILKGLGYDCAKIRGVVEQQARASVAVGELKDLPFSRPAKKFLEQSKDEADRLDLDYIGCEHLLLSLLHEQLKGTVPGRILSDFGITFERADRSVKQMVPLLEPV